MSEPTGKEIAEANFLKNRIFGDDLELDKSDPDAPDPNPFPEMIRKNQVAAAVKSANGASVQFDWALPPESDVDDDTPSFWKAPQIVRHQAAPNAFTKADRTPNTLAKKLGITRTEQVTTESGDVWVHAFNSSNELVDARLIKSAD